MGLKLGLVVQRCTAGCLLAVVLVALVAPRNTWFVFDRGPVVLVWLLALGVATQIRGARLDRLSAAHPMRMVLLGSVAGLLISAVVAAGTLIQFGWDARAVASVASALVEGGQLSDQQVDYFARFPNNVPLLAFEVVLGSIGKVLGLSMLAMVLAAQVVAAGIVTLSLGWTAVVLGHPGRVLPVQAASLLLIGLSPHLMAPYSDVLAAACVSAAVLFMAKAHAAGRSGRSRHLVLAVIALGVGTAIKPFVAVLIIAIVLVKVAQGCSKRSWSGLASVGADVVLIVAISSAMVLGCGAAAGQVTGLTDERLEQVRDPFPVSLWMAAGTYDSQDHSPVRRYGAYNQQLVDLAASIDDSEQQRDVLRNVAVQHVRERGLLGNLSFFGRKVAWVWGDGTFWAYGEGTDSQREAYLADSSLGWISEWNTATGEHYQLRASLTQGLWLALLTWAAVQVWRARSDTLLTTWTLALVGLSGYLLIFEARPRYLLALVPVVLALLLTSRDGVETRSAEGRVF